MAEQISKDFGTNFYTQISKPNTFDVIGLFSAGLGGGDCETDRDR